MPNQKDLKRIVRARMEKTGEAYTAARVHVVSKKKESEPPPDYAPRAGMSDAAVKKATGRDWTEWVTTLDAAKANEKAHREIVGYVSSLGTPDWWSQMVTVGYERVRGLRDKGQRRGGAYEANKSRTFAVPVETLYEAIHDGRTRKRWLQKALKVRTATAPKTIRGSFEDGTLVQFYFTDKGGKSAVAVTQEKLADQDAAEAAKRWWGERLDALGEMLSEK
jgi:hypothetical protein